MTVEKITNKEVAQQMGTLTDYQFTFNVLLKDPTSDEALQAIRAKVKQANGVEIDLVYGTDYSVTLNSDRSGGYITVNDIRTSDDYITIYRQYTLKQEADFQDFNAAPAETKEQCFDKLTMLEQQQQEELDRAIKVQMTSDISPEVLVAEVERIYDSIDNIDTVADNIDDVIDVADNSANINTVAGSIGNVNAVGNNISAVNNVSSNTITINKVAEDLFGDNNIGTVAGISTDVTSVANVASDISVVADDLTNIDIVANNIGDVNTAAQNIDDIKDASDNAELSRLWSKGPENDLQTKTQDPTAHSSKYYSEQSAQAQIQSDCAQTDTTMKSYINNKDLQYFSNAVTKFANQDLSDLSEIGEKHFLNKTQITNCILQDPQNIKLELNNGTLTLKAGSVICVPNEFETDGTTPKFDEVTVANDLSKTQTTDGTMTVFVNTTGTGISIFASISDGSGSTPPSTGTYDFYNTTENKLFRYSNGVAGNQYAFPIAKVTVSNGAISSIDEVYQSVGYIGSTVFARKGLRGLFPNYKNPDGSLKNIEFETERVIIGTGYDNNATSYALLDYNNGSLRIVRSGITITSYDEVNNIMYRQDGLFPNSIALAIVTATDKITDFKPKTTFHAVNYNDNNLPQVDGQWIPNVINIIDSSTTLAGQTTKTYSLSSYLPDDGNIYEVLFTCNGNTSTTSGDYADIAIGSDIIGTNNNRVASATPRSANHVRWAGCGIIPISTSRNIYIRQIGPSDCTCLYFRCVGYRRIGTNN